MCVCVTYCGSVFSNKPEMVAEQGQNTDAEHGRHKKQKQDMEFGLWPARVIQLVLWKETREEGENQSATDLPSDPERREVTSEEENL